MRPVYTVECHDCHTTHHFDTWQERQLWTINHTQTPLTIIGKTFTTNHRIHQYQQDWHGRLD